MQKLIHLRHCCWPNIRIFYVCWVGWCFVLSRVAFGAELSNTSSSINVISEGHIYLRYFRYVFKYILGKCSIFIKSFKFWTSIKITNINTIFDNVIVILKHQHNHSTKERTNRRNKTKTRRRRPPTERLVEPVAKIDLGVGRVLKSHRRYQTNWKDVGKLKTVEPQEKKPRDRPRTYAVGTSLKPTDPDNFKHSTWMSAQIASEPRPTVEP